MMRWKQAKKVIQIVGSWNCQARLLKQCLKVLLGRLLAMKADLIMKWLASARGLYGQAVIAFGLPHPGAGGLFHKELCLVPQFPYGRSHLPPTATACCLACE